MKKKKFIGVTLLFFQIEKSIYIAFLKSYIVECNSWDDLQKKVEQIVFADKLTYLGIEDIYYVSGAFGEKEVLGKSYIDEFIKIKDAKSLLLKQKEYTCNFQTNNQKKKWFLVSLIYFYHDKFIKDKLVISCFTAVFTDNIKNAKIKIKDICEKEFFLKKVLPFELDKMSYSNLKYIGIEDISYIAEVVEQGGPIEYSFKKYKTFETLKKLLPPKAKILKSYEQVIKV